MKRNINFIVLLALFLSVLSIEALPIHAQGKTANNDSYGRTFYEDVPEAQSNPLGAAGYFHIFSNEAILRNHTNGNVATKMLTGTSNFGTGGLREKEYNYIQDQITTKNISRELGQALNEQVSTDRLAYLQSIDTD